MIAAAVVTGMIVVMYAIHRGNIFMVVILVEGIQCVCCDVVASVIFAVVGGESGTVTKMIKKSFGINKIVRKWLILIQNSLPLTFGHNVEE